MVKSLLITPLLMALLSAPALSQEYESAHWGQLSPAGWPDRDPLQGVDVSRLEDDDPKAIALYAQLRAYKDQAPTVPELDGRRLSLPGYLVPLPEEDHQSAGGQYLLVPYDGACIHQPAPARNQTVLIRVPDELDVRLEDRDGALQLYGELSVDHRKTSMAATGYTLTLHKTAPYRLRFN
ncbi:MAG: DUF3299 domain-containing protein [Oleiphilaceae bacterium]|nr:DUF3299 domain-containing protein [Oleiphilaceae bacterium]